MNQFQVWNCGVTEIIFSFNCVILGPCKKCDHHDKPHTPGDEEPFEKYLTGPKVEGGKTKSIAFDDKLELENNAIVFGTKPANSRIDSTEPDGHLDSPGEITPDKDQIPPKYQTVTPVSQTNVMHLLKPDQPKPTPLLKSDKDVNKVYEPPAVSIDTLNSIHGNSQPSPGGTFQKMALLTITLTILASIIVGGNDPYL